MAAVSPVEMIRPMNAWLLYVIRVLSESSNITRCGFTAHVRNTVATPREYKIISTRSEEPFFPERKIPAISFLGYFIWERNIL